MEQQTILFLRSAQTYESKELALQALNTLTHKVGQPVVALYTEEEATKMVYAIGKVASTGETSYEVFATEADLSELATLISDTADDLTTHAALSAGSELGHAKTGGDLTFAEGVATVNNNAITYAKLQSIVAERGAVLGATAAGAVTELDKTALLGMLNIADGAEVNQNAFSNVQIGEETIAAASKTDTLTITGDGNISVTKGDEDNAVHIGLAGTLQADQLKNALTFTGAEDGKSFNGSAAVSVNIPKASDTTPVVASTGAAGSSADFARADHVHPAQTDVTGNAGTATKLQNAQTINLTGAVTGTVSTDFSNVVNITTTLADHVHDIEDVTGLQDALDLKAPLASPALTGTPTAPTASVGTNTTQIATTAFVAAEISSKLAANNAMRFKGTYGTDGTVEALPIDATVGDTYVAVEGAEAVNGVALEAGDMVICIANEGGSATEWTAVNVNVNGTVTSSSSTSVDGNVAVYDGVTGKLIKDSGVAASALVQNTRNITAGSGLTGGGALSADVTISHAAKPGEGTDAGGTGDYVSGVTIDSFGHVVSTTKATLPTETGKVKVEEAGAADYLENKVVAGTANAETNTYAVTVTKAEDKLKLTVDIEIIDGGTFE